MEKIELNGKIISVSRIWKETAKRTNELGKIMFETKAREKITFEGDKESIKGFKAKDSCKITIKREQQTIKESTNKALPDLDKKKKGEKKK